MTTTPPNRLAEQTDDVVELPPTNDLENKPNERHSIGKEINLKSLEDSISGLKASMQMNVNCQDTLAQKYLRTDMLLYRSMHNSYVREMSVDFERYKKLQELYLATGGRNEEASTICCEGYFRNTELSLPPERRKNRITLRSSRLNC